VSSGPPRTTGTDVGLVFGRNNRNATVQTLAQAAVFTSYNQLDARSSSTPVVEPFSAISLASPIVGSYGATGGDYSFAANQLKSLKVGVGYKATLFTVGIDKLPNFLSYHQLEVAYD
jgi:hypothetical protein